MCVRLIYLKFGFKLVRCSLRLVFWRWLKWLLSCILRCKMGVILLTLFTSRVKSICMKIWFYICLWCVRIRKKFVLILNLCMCMLRLMIWLSLKIFWLRRIARISSSLSIDVLVKVCTRLFDFCILCLVIGVVL